MKKIKITKMLLCLAFVSIISIGTASSKMFGSTCAWSIGYGPSGCEITITKTTYVFWMEFSSGSVYNCDWGLSIDQLCG